ncbi:MAG: ABC transporter substrate-binding protein [Deinococcales bacterium]
MNRKDKGLAGAIRQPISRRKFMKFAAATGASTYLLSHVHAQEQEIKRGGTLRVAFTSSPNEFDPALGTSFEDYNASFAIYESLIKIDASLSPRPGLATAWENSDDALTWVFHLREGVMFHDGSSLGAGDAAHSINRLLDETVGSPLRTPLAFIDSAEALDEMRVQVNLNSPNGDLPLLLGAPQAKIVKEGSSSEDLRATPNGTGPFKLVEHLPGSHTLFEANADYWDEGKPYLEKLRFVAMPEAATQVAAISGGQIDFIWALGSENIPLLERTRNVSVLQVPSGAYQTIAFNAEMEPFDDPRVREAIKLCVDREGMLQAVLQGRGNVANDHPIPAFNAFYHDMPIRQRDPVKAKALLVEAGYENGLDLTLTTSTVRPGLIESAVALQEMAKEAGINISIDRVPPDNFWSEYWMKRPFFCSNWGMRPSIDETFMVAYHSEAKWNEGFYRDAELDAAIEAGRTASDPEIRKGHYAKAQELLHDRGGVVISYFRPVLQAHRDNVEGFNPHPAAWLYLAETWLS